MGRLKGYKQGFTLIELLVVIVIVALLMAIAIPAYISQQNKAKDSRSKHDLAVAWKEARSVATETGGAYPSAAAIVSQIQSSEPAFPVKTGAGSASVTQAGQLVVDTTSNSTNLIIWEKSQSGKIIRLDTTKTNSPVFTTFTSTPSYSGAVLGDSPISLWPMDEGSGALADSAAAKTASPLNSPSYSQTSNSGAFGTSVGFSAGGVESGPTWSSRFDVNDATNSFNFSGNASFSAEAWIKQVAAPDGFVRPIFYREWNDGNQQGWSLIDYSAGVRCERFRNGVNDTVDYMIADTSSWHYVICTYDGSALKLYVDGSLVGTTPSAFALVSDSGLDAGASYKLFIGGSPGLRSFRGYIDNAAIYPSALSGAAVSNHWASR